MTTRLLFNLGPDEVQHEGFATQTEWMRRDHDLVFITFFDRDGNMLLLMPEGSEAGVQFHVGAGVARHIDLPDGGHMSCDDEMLEVIEL